MKALLFIFFIFYALNLQALIIPITSGSAQNVCSSNNVAGTYHPHHQSGCSNAGVDAYPDQLSGNVAYQFSSCLDTGGGYYDGITFNKRGDSCNSTSTLLDTFIYYRITSCPSGESDPNLEGNPCIPLPPPPPSPETGATAIGQCYAWKPDCNESDIIDNQGNLWTNDGLGICDADLCLQQWTKSDTTVDPNDPTTWPDNTIASDYINAPSTPGASEESPFDDWTQGFPTSVEVETDTETSSSSDGSSSSTTTTTEIGQGDSGLEKTETTETTSTDSSGNTTTTTTTKTTDSSGNVTTSTTSTTTDSGGTVTSTSSSDSTDQGGEEENDGRSVSGGGSCSSRPVCEGDPVNCAILLQDWEQQCAGEKSLKNLATDAESELSSQGMTDLDDIGEGDLLDEIGIDDLDLQSEYGNFLTAPGNTAACPSPLDVDLGLFGTVQLPFDLFCDLADYLRYIVLLAAYYIGGTIVLRSLVES